jgi:hypothetical protein
MVNVTLEVNVCEQSLQRHKERQAQIESAIPQGPPSVGIPGNIIDGLTLAGKVVIKRLALKRKVVSSNEEINGSKNLPSAPFIARLILVIIAIKTEVDAAIADLRAIEKVSATVSSATTNAVDCRRTWEKMQKAIWLERKNTVEKLLLTSDMDELTREQLNQIFSGILTVLRRVVTDVSTTSLFLQRMADECLFLDG